MSDAGALVSTKLKVFISYSRKDSEFAEELLSGLELAGFEPYLDKHDIAPGEDWEVRLDRLIAAADTVIFVISPDSVASDRCAWEVKRTVEQKKRILPVVWRRVDEAQVPPPLKQLNYIFFDRPLMSIPSLTALDAALKTDLGWIREHTRIAEAGLRWDGRGRSEALLFRGDELAAAKTWLANPPQYAPEPTLLHHEFIKAGEDAHAARDSAERKTIDDMRAALDREKAAQVEREKAQGERETALQRERAALDRIKRAQMAIGVLSILAIAGITSVIFKEQIVDFAFKQTTVRTFIADQVRPHLLSADAERALKPGSTFRECVKNCPEMIVVPAGSFRRGSPATEVGRDSDEGPLRTVTIAMPFAVAKFEVTWDEWEACVLMRGCDGRPTGDATLGKGRKPVVNVSWDQARSYVQWLSRMTSKEYRLLTEAEWEYVARAGTHTAYSFGNTPIEICRHANLADQSYRRAGYTAASVSCDDGHATTAPVGNYPANPFGVHDMHGNVWEWVQDCYDEEGYATAPTDGSAAVEKEGCDRVVRGGSWFNDPAELRSAWRHSDATDIRSNDVGIRVARVLLPVSR